MLFPSLKKHKKLLVGTLFTLVIASSVPIQVKAQVVGDCSYQSTIDSTGVSRTYSVSFTDSRDCVVGKTTNEQVKDPTTGQFTLAQTTVVTSFSARESGPRPVAVSDGSSSNSGGSLCAFPIAGPVICDLVTAIIMIPLGFSSFILYLSATVLDWVLQYTVVNIAANISGISGINIAWSVIRDLVNFSFIFILLYTAIEIILNRGDSGMMKKTITGIVMAAILINFSLFFTKVIVDTSNLIAITFNNQIVTSCDPVGRSLSGCFNQSLGINSIFKLDDATGKNLLTELRGSPLKASIVSLGGSIFIIITAFVFLAAAVMFFMRFVTIVFLLIFSPLMVLGSLIPRMQEYTKQWWSELMDQVIFAPIFMLLTWVVLVIISSPGFRTIGGGGISDVFNGVASSTLAASGTTAGQPLGSLDLIGNFIIIIAFMIGVLTISKGFSKRGGEMGSKFAGAVMGGGGGYIGRRTLGSAGRAISDSEKLKQKASEKGWGGMAARMALRGGQKTAGANFDARATGAGKALGAGKATGKGGFDAYTKEKMEAKTKFADSLKPSDIEIDNAKQALANAKTPEEKAAAQARLDQLEGISQKVANERNNKAFDSIKENVEKDLGTKKAAYEAQKVAAEEEAGRLVNKTPEQIKLEQDIATAKVDGENTTFLESELATLNSQHEQNVKNKVQELLKDTKEELEFQKAQEKSEKLSGIKADDTKAIGSILSEAGRYAEKLDSTADRRKMGYASVVTSTSPISTNRVGLVGKIKKANLQAAARMRGVGAKSNEQKIAELAIKAAKKDLEDKGETPKPEATTPPSPPKTT